MPSARKDHPRPTLAAVARELGVSKATVSNAYNRPDQLSPALRQRVLAAAARLGYTGPDPLAATLSRGRVGALGLVLDDPVSYAITDPAEVRFLAGVSEACDRAGIGLVLIPGGLDTHLARTALVDGFICHTDVIDDPRVAGLLDRGLPTVLVDGYAPDVTSVVVEDRAGAAAAAQHLINLGHRHLAILATPLTKPAETGMFDPARQADIRYRVPRERLLGYLDPLNHGVTAASSVDLVVYQTTGEPTHAGYVAATKVLRPPASRRPTALLAMSDGLALGALNAACDLDLHVPADLSIIGFDNTLAPSLRPALTTVNQPHHIKGSTAADLVINPPPNPTREVRLSTELITRASTAPPP